MVCPNGFGKHNAHPNNGPLHWRGKSVEAYSMQLEMKAFQHGLLDTTDNLLTQ